MLWDDDKWFKENRGKAREAENAGDTAGAERLYRSLYEKAMEAGEEESVHEARLEWMHFLVFACRFQEARLEGERFLSDLGGRYPLVRARLNLHLASAAYYLNQYDEVITIAQRNLSEDHGTYPARLRVEIYNQLGLAERHLGMYEGAIEHFHEALLLTRTQKLEDDGTYDGNLALVYEDQGRLLEALESYEVALTKARKAHSEEMTVFALTGLGAARYQIGEFPEARAALEEALQRSEAMDNSLMTQNIFVLLADLAREEGDLVEAMDNATAALFLAQEKHIPESEAEAHLAYGWILLERNAPGDTVEALEHATQALEIYPKLDLTFGFVSALTLKAAALRASGENDKAKAGIEKALNLSKQTGIRDAKVFYIAGEVLDKAGLHENAVECFTRARLLVDEKSEALPSEARDIYLSRPDITKILRKD